MKKKGSRKLEFMSDLAAQVYRESTADDPAQPMPRLNSVEIDEDVLEGRQAFSFVPARAAAANDEDDDEDDDDEEDFNDREFYSHGAQRAAGVDVPRSESSRQIRVFKSSRRAPNATAATASSTASAAEAAAQSDDVVALSEPLSLWASVWSFVWGGLSEPLIKGALIGVGACVVHYLLVKRRG